MGAHKDFDDLKQKVDNLEDDMGEIENNFKCLRMNLQNSIDGLEDIGMDASELYLILQELDKKLEKELSELVDNCLDKMTGI